MLGRHTLALYSVEHHHGFIEIRYAIAIFLQKFIKVDDFSGGSNIISNPRTNLDSSVYSIRYFMKLLLCEIVIIVALPAMNV